ncbi:MAG: hypothetical protein R6X33_16285, partial [Candidatus Brocadiia bacterium]
MSVIFDPQSLLSMIRTITRKQAFTALFLAIIPAVAAFLLFPYLPAILWGGVWAGLFAAGIGICAFFAGINAAVRQENRRQSDGRQRYERLFAG